MHIPHSFRVLLGSISIAKTRTKRAQKKRLLKIWSLLESVDLIRQIYFCIEPIIFIFNKFSIDHIILRLKLWDYIRKYLKCIQARYSASVDY